MISLNFCCNLERISCLFWSRRTKTDGKKSFGTKKESFGTKRGEGRVLWDQRQGKPSSKKKLPRKIVEKRRREQMKVLSFKLVSLIPDGYLPQPKEFLSQQDQIGYSEAYILILKERLEELRKRKTQLTNFTNNNNMVESKKQPPIDLTVKELGSDVEVVLISGLIKNFRLHDVITIIEEAAAEVRSVNIATIGAQIIHVIHTQAKISRVGVDTARINARMQELISST